MFIVKSGATTVFPSSWCLGPRDSLIWPLCDTMSKLQKTAQDVSIYRESKINAGSLQLGSFYPIFAVPHEFLLVKLDGFITCIAFFCCEEWHISLCRPSSVLRKFMPVMIKRNIRTIFCMTTKSEATKSFRTVQNTAPRVASRFLELVQRSSMGNGLYWNSCKGSRSDQLNEFFTDSGLCGMVEANEHAYTDRILLFVAQMVDRCCNLNDAQLAQAFGR